MKSLSDFRIKQTLSAFSIIAFFGGVCHAHAETPVLKSADFQAAPVQQSTESWPASPQNHIFVAPARTDPYECVLQWIDYWECLIRNPHCPMLPPTCMEAAVTSMVLAAFR